MTLCMIALRMFFHSNPARTLHIHEESEWQSACWSRRGLSFAGDLPGPVGPEASPSAGFEVMGAPSPVKIPGADSGAVVLRSSRFLRPGLCVLFFLHASLLVGAGLPSAGAGSVAQAELFPQEWNLASALQRAMQANPDLLAAKYEVEREEGVRLQVQARLLPRITASASADEREAGLVDRSPTEFNVPPSQRSAIALRGHDLRIEVRQLAFDSFSAWNQVQRQKLRKKQSYLNFLNTANQTAGLVRQVYDAVLLRRKQLEGERHRVEDLEQLVGWAARKQEVGEIAEFELLTAQTQLQTARAEVSDAERELLNAEQQFRRLLQIPDTKAPLMFVGEIEMRQFELGYDAAVELAFKRRPDLESATLAVAATKRQQRALLGDQLPKFEFFASYGMRSSYYDSSKYLQGWTIGALGQWNLFDGGDNRGRRRALLAERRIAETRLDEIEHQLVSRLRELYQELAQSRQAITAQESGKKLASRALHQARRLYENGQAGMEQVLQSQMVALRAENRHLESIYRYNVTVSRIEFAIGGAEDEAISGVAPWKQ